MTKVTIAKKISMKQLTGNVKMFAKTLEHDGQQMAIARVVGIARGLKTGQSNFGDYTALTGDFIAEALVGDRVGNRYRTGTIFLPDVAQDLVLPHVHGLEKGEGVELSFEIGIEANEASTTGYIYTAAFLTEPAENDPLEALAAKALPALEAPKTDEKKK